MNETTTAGLKGQYMSFDMIVASVLFLLTLSMLFNYWNYVAQNREMEDRKLHAKAIEYSIALEQKLASASTGVATDWNAVSDSIADDLSLGADTHVSVKENLVLVVDKGPALSNPRAVQSVFRLLRYNGLANNVTIELSN